MVHSTSFQNRTLAAIFLFLCSTIQIIGADIIGDPNESWGFLDDGAAVAERFFSSCRISASYYQTNTIGANANANVDANANNNNQAQQHSVRTVKWATSTPFPVIMGTSLLVLTDPEEEELHYRWQHHFFENMDDPQSMAPSMAHMASVTIHTDENAEGGAIIADISPSGDPLPSVNGNLTVAVRMFVFVPFGKGTFVSRTFALKLPALEGTSKAPLTIYELDYSEWGEDDAPSETLEYTRPTVPAPSYLNNKNGGLSGESPLAFAVGRQYLVAESEGTVSANLYENAIIELRLKVDEVEGMDMGTPEGTLSSPITEHIAASFHYALDPVPSGYEDSLDFNSFFDDGLYHGLVRAREVPVTSEQEPVGTLYASSLPPSAWEDPSTILYAGAVWLDDMMNVRFATEGVFSLAVFSYTIPTETPLASVDGDGDTQISPYDKICPPESIRNLALSTEGALILDVSSNWGRTPDGIYSDKGATKAIDGLDDTNWATDTDGDDAYISIQLASPSNILYTEFHTMSMGSNVQIYSYQVEASKGGKSFDVIVASDCNLPDALRSYRCDLNIGDSTLGASVVTFRVLRSTGGNTGAYEIGVYGCAANEQPPATGNGMPSFGTCTSDDDCFATVRSREPKESSVSFGLCDCYAASRTKPFDECEGQDDCKTARCRNTCEGSEARCAAPLDGSEGESRMCELYKPPPIEGPPPMPGACASDDECTATIRTRMPQQQSGAQSSVGVNLCVCYAASNTDPFDECEGQDRCEMVDISECMPSCNGMMARCMATEEWSEGGSADRGTKMCQLYDSATFATTDATPLGISTTTQAPPVPRPAGPPQEFQNLFGSVLEELQEETELIEATSWATAAATMRPNPAPVAGPTTPAPTMDDRGVSSSSPTTSPFQSAQEASPSPILPNVNDPLVPAESNGGGSTSSTPVVPNATDSSSVPIDDSTGKCISDDECTAKVRSRLPTQSSGGAGKLCICYAASSTHPLDECEGEDDSTCAITKCPNNCDGLVARCVVSSAQDDADRGTKKMCVLQEGVVSSPEESSASIDGEGMSSEDVESESDESEFESDALLESAGMLQSVSFGVTTMLLPVILVL